MAEIAALGQQRREILERIEALIEALKQEIRDKEPTLDDITRFVQENHPKRQEQRVVEEQLRQAQSALEDMKEAMEQVVVKWR